MCTSSLGKNPLGAARDGGLNSPRDKGAIRMTANSSHAGLIRFMSEAKRESRSGSNPDYWVPWGITIAIEPHNPEERHIVAHFISPRWSDYKLRHRPSKGNVLVQWSPTWSSMFSLILARPLQGTLGWADSPLLLHCSSTIPRYLWFHSSSHMPRADCRKNVIFWMCTCAFALSKSWGLLPFFLFLEEYLNAPEHNRSNMAQTSVTVLAYLHGNQ